MNMETPTSIKDIQKLTGCMAALNRFLSRLGERGLPFFKLLYAILITSRKLRHYFDEYKISIVTDFPLGDILHNRDATGRISKWAVELGALELKFAPRTAIKSQALADFLAEWRENQVPTPPSISDH